MKGFWEKLKKPIIGLAPMDGVTDAAFRFMTAKHGHPHVIYTEFIAAEGIAAGALRLMRDFQYHEIERPVVAQVFGSHPDAFYQAAVVVAELGFDGIDINMGCPARNIADRGNGAALIRAPALAKEIVRASRRGLRDWANGISLEDAHLHPAIIEYMRVLYTQRASGRATVGGVRAENVPARRILPLSIKTRIGYDSVIVEEWIQHLLEVEPAVIAIHGRTLKQLYSGKADWSAIERAARIACGSGILIFGNGDVQTLEQAREYAEQCGVDGVLIGRASRGNPWVFAESRAAVSYEDKLRAALEHARYFEAVFSGEQFINMRKHLAWYCSGFDGALKMRTALMSAKCADDVEKIILKQLNI